MIQPDLLKTPTPLLWSPGTGIDVWEMFCACVAGDFDTVKRLVAREPAMVRCHYVYRTPLYFAVRENRLEVASCLLDHGAHPFNSGSTDTLLEIARDRGYVEMARLL